MIKIEIFKENENFQTSTIPGKEGKPSRTIYEQTAYAYLGGKFPVQMKLSLEEGQPPYVAGEYTVHSSSKDALWLAYRYMTQTKLITSA
ncbi:single-stranded DNA-binding protein [Vibrio anguillarum]|uniref:single-stranded DNA-binding protein n=1 Tax=Vibrio anguillarum TaxID=55601 RepID=UPI000CA301BD|nr:single-stranded DNA-binding protein [Vibrio anguillarum]AUB85743.1 hypothetical protein CKY00_00060 [Vibrio anguillarum]AUB89181.1 hypothetical protein CKX99_00060 [Vibrio anguillarum]AUB92622.1 hypothetical protein CK210_00060 [Vibrio anguillarum]AUB96056.1 hypothetical protein CK209_00060 [Vibrio anguillarum]AXM46183.1 hypothetical protein DD760_00035 [Vibrio anguillarum]